MKHISLPGAYISDRELEAGIVIQDLPQHEKWAEQTGLPCGRSHHRHLTASRPGMPMPDEALLRTGLELPLVRSRKGQPRRAPELIDEPRLHRTKQREMSWRRPAKIVPSVISYGRLQFVRVKMLSVEACCILLQVLVINAHPFMLLNAMSPAKAVTSGQLGSGGLGSAKKRADVE